MTTTINASTTAGLVQTADTSGVLALQTAGTTAISIDASQNVNFAGTAQRITGDFSNATVANRVMFQTSTANGTTSIATLPNGTNATSSVLAFGGSDPANAPFTGFNNTATESQILASKIGTGTYLPMTFYTGGSESLRLSATTKAVILAGGSTSANGTGIAFPATQSASTDVNTLDDYEEGTFTPTIVGLTSAGTGTYSNQTGSYVKVGQIVSIYIRIDWSAHTGTGNMGFGGLPFTTAGTYTNGAALNGMAGLTVPASCYVSANVNTSNTTGLFLAIPVGGGNDSQLAMDTAGIVLFTITYRASA